MNSRVSGQYSHTILKTQLDEKPAVNGSKGYLKKNTCITIRKYLWKIPKAKIQH